MDNVPQGGSRRHPALDKTSSHLPFCPCSEAYAGGGGGYSPNSTHWTPMSQVFQFPQGQDVVLTAEATAQQATRGPDHVATRSSRYWQYTPPLKLH